MKQQSIWIIDDDSIFKIIVQKLIDKTQKFNNVLTFSNGEEASLALRKCLEQQEDFPDVILLDIEMPIMDGWEFMSELDYLKLPSNRNSLKIYISSSSIAIEDKLKAEKYPNILGYLTKPISLDDLMKIAS